MQRATSQVSLWLWFCRDLGNVQHSRSTECLTIYTLQLVFLYRTNQNNTVWGRFTIQTSVRLLGDFFLLSGSTFSNLLTGYTPWTFNWVQICTLLLLLPVNLYVVKDNKWNRAFKKKTEDASMTPWTISTYCLIIIKEQVVMSYGLSNILLN